MSLSPPFPSFTRYWKVKVPLAFAGGTKVKVPLAFAGGTKVKVPSSLRESDPPAIRPARRSARRRPHPCRPEGCRWHRCVVLDARVVLGGRNRYRDIIDRIDGDGEGLGIAESAVRVSHAILERHLAMEVFGRLVANAAVLPLNVRPSTSRPVRRSNVAVYVRAGGICPVIVVSSSPGALLPSSSAYGSIVRVRHRDGDRLRCRTIERLDRQGLLDLAHPLRGLGRLVVDGETPLPGRLVERKRSVLLLQILFGDGLEGVLAPIPVRDVEIAAGGSSLSSETAPVVSPVISASNSASISASAWASAAMMWVSPKNWPPCRLPRMASMRAPELRHVILILEMRRDPGQTVV